MAHHMNRHSDRTAAAIACLALGIAAILAAWAPAAHAAVRVLDEGTEYSWYTTAVAPDTRALVFMKQSFSSTKTLSHVQLASGAQTTLATWGENTWPDSPHWSPDSQWVAVIVIERDVTARSTRIDLIAADGTQTTTLAQVASACTPTISAECGLQWVGYTPDGDVLYRLLTPTTSAIYRATLTPRGAIETVRLSPDGLRADSCTLSPTLRWLACLGGDQIYTLLTDGAAQTANMQLAITPSAWPPLFFFSPRGSRLLIQPDMFGGGMLYSAAPDRANETVVLTQEPIPESTSGYLYRSAPVVTPDDRAVIVHQPSGLVQVPLSGPASAASLLVPKVSTPEVAYSESFQLAANGERLILGRSGAWALVGHGYDPNLLGVFSIPIDVLAESATRLIEHVPVSMELAKDGQHLIYQPSSTSARLVIMPVAGPASSSTEVALAGPSSYVFVQAVQSSFLLQHGSTLYTIPSDGHRNAEPIFTPSGDEQISSVTPDPSGLVMIVTSGATRLRVADLGRLRAGFAASGLCIAEPDGGARISIMLDSPSVVQRTLSYRVSGGSAQESDYTLPLSGTLTFPAGERFVNIAVGVHPDDIDEIPETVELTLEADADLELRQSQLTVTILDRGSCQSMLPLSIKP